MTKWLAGVIVAVSVALIGITGDTSTCTIESIGTLQNPVKAEE